MKSVIEENEGIGELMLSPTGGKLGYEVDNALVVRSLAEPDAPGLRLSGPEAGLNGIGFSPDGRTLYSRGGDRLLVWDLVGDRRFVRSVQAQPRRDPPQSPWRWCLPTDGPWRTSSTADQESFAVQLLDVQSGTRTPQSALESQQRLLRRHRLAAGRRGCVASAQNDQWVDLWDGVTGQAAGRHRVPDRYGVVETVRFSGDSTRLVVGTHQGWVYAVDASTLEVLGKPVQVKADVPMRGVAANGDGAGRWCGSTGSSSCWTSKRAGCSESVDPGFVARLVGLGARRERRRRGRQRPLSGRPRHDRPTGSADPVDEVQGDGTARWLSAGGSSSPPMASGSRPPGTQTEWACGSANTVASLGSVRADDGQHRRVRPRHLRRAHRLARRNGVGLGPDGPRPRSRRLVVSPAER